MILKKIKLKQALLTMLLLFFGVFANAQEKSISGNVIADSDGVGLPGVNVVVKGTAVGTVTDFDGNYEINVPSDDAILVFSYIGFVTQEIPVSSKSEINISLLEDAANLDEVVVIGYGTQRKGDLTGSIATIKSEDLTKVTTTNLGQAVQGRVAGVQVTQNSGEPGSGTTVKIRGIGSILSSNGPLVLINGFQGSLDNIDADNVESITVLKDAAAASIYGSRAANGVILVTTKRESRNKLDVTVKSEVGFQSLTQSPDYLNSQDWARRQNEARANNGQAPLWDASSLLPEDITTNTDWLDFSTRNGLMQDYHVGLSGSVENTNYAVGIGYVKQEGIIIGTDFDRYNIRLNLDQIISDKMKFGVNLSTYRNEYASTLDVFTNGGRGILNLINAAAPTMVPYDALGQPSLPLYPGEEHTLLANVSPALANSIQNDTQKISEVAANVYGEVELFEGLRYRLGLNGSINNRKIHQFDRFYEIYDVNDLSVVLLQSAAAILNESSRERVFWEIQNTLTYTKSFGDHNLNVLLGQSGQRNTEENLSASGQGFPSNDIQSLSAAEIPGAVGGNNSVLSISSLFGRVTYNYKNKYLLQGNIRRDGTSVFAPSKQYGVFPSVSVGWTISEENFLKESDLITNLKLRYGYGDLGNAQIPSFSWISTFNVDNSTIFGSGQTFAAAYQIQDLSNVNVKWETTTTSNFGIDLSMFNGKFGLTADIYSKSTTDMLLRVPVSPASGFYNGPISNLGEVKNNGWEALVSYNDSFGDFNLGASFNISRNTNEVVSLGETSAYTTGVNRVEEGLPLFAYWGYKTNGIWQNQAEIDANPSIGDARPGTVRYVDLDGNGEINDDDKTEIGNILPDFIYGFNINAEYKNFDLSVFFQGEANKNMAIETAFGGLGSGDSQNIDRSFYDNRALLDADGNVSGGGTGQALGRFSGQWSDYNIQDVSYLRIKNIQLGYSLSTSITEKIGLNSLRLYINLTNPILWTDYVGYDPEFLGSQNSGRSSRGGVDYYPQVKTSTFGINMSF